MPSPLFTRRHSLASAGLGFGSWALLDLMERESRAAQTPNPLAAKKPHFPAKAKSVIFLMMAGGPSQMETFDPPRPGLLAKRILAENGAYRVKNSRQRHVITFFARIPSDQIPTASAPTKPKRDPLPLARFYQSLLDGGVVESRAALARHLQVSRARVTQVLARLQPDHQNPSETTTTDSTDPSLSG